MPPTSNIRKTSIANNNAIADPSLSTKRTASGRAIRTNTTRPTNYYARPFGSLSAGAAANVDNEAQAAAEPGFFPALQYFSDAITALPKEVMRQFTLMKEVEAKIHGPNEKLGEMVDALMELPVPPRKGVQSQQAATQQALLSLTASNSAVGSANASLINGVAGGRQLSAQNSMSGSVVGEEAQQEPEEELARRRQYYDLRLFTHNLLPNLDEKNVVLAEANRVLALQLSRIDSVMPHLENEISEEARLGSMTHWAYSDNRQKKTVPPPAPSRRDVAATNSLAAAANAIHETEIAQARRAAGREADREKHVGKGKRQQELVDSDFDDKPKKQAKLAGKSKAAAAAQANVTGLGITTNGEPVKRRKVDKNLMAPAMERTLSSTSKAGKAMRETPRSTPAAEPTKKATKAKPAPPSKKRVPTSAQNSPMLASSPLHSLFNPTNMEPPPSARPQSARLRQNSSATNLRHERTADEESKPASAAGKANGNVEKSNGKRKAPPAPEEAEEQGDTAEERAATKTTERGDEMKREDADITEKDRPAPARSHSNTRKTGTTSKTGTPRNETFSSDAPSMKRTRSTRSLRNTARDSSSSEPQQQGVARVKHKRNTSSSHLVKQLAPYNKSPDLNRHKDDMDDDLESLDDRELDQDEQEEERGRRGRRSRPISRRNTLQQQTSVAAGAASPPASVHAEEEEEEEQAVDVPAATPPTEDLPTAVEEVNPPSSEPDSPSPPPPDLEPDTAGIDEVEGQLEPEPEPEPEDIEGEESEHDPDDPNEPKYCYCNRGSYGEMVACDNDNCPREWFHLGCTELREAPGESAMWYCKECRPLFSKKRGNGKGRPGSSRQ